MGTLLGWIIAQVTFISLDSWLQVTYLTDGLLILALALRPRMRPPLSCPPHSANDRHGLEESAVAF